MEFGILRKLHASAHLYLIQAKEEKVDSKQGVFFGMSIENK
jgi:hypothetical protein